MSLTVRRKLLSHDASFLYFYLSAQVVVFVALVNYGVRPHAVFLVVKLERYKAFFPAEIFTRNSTCVVQAEPFKHFVMQSRANIALMIQPVSAFF